MTTLTACIQEGGRGGGGGLITRWFSFSLVNGPINEGGLKSEVYGTDCRSTDVVHATGSLFYIRLPDQALEPRENARAIRREEEGKRRACNDCVQIFISASSRNDIYGFLWLAVPWLVSKFLDEIFVV